MSIFDRFRKPSVTIRLIIAAFLFLQCNSVTINTNKVIIRADTVIFEELPVLPPVDSVDPPVDPPVEPPIIIPPPSDGAYPYGILPTNRKTLEDLRPYYEDIIAVYYEDCGENARMKWGQEENDWEHPHQTISEIIAYSMALASYYGDKERFDKWYGFHQKFARNYLMDWKINGCNDIDDTGSATDCSVVAAFGLINMYKRFGNSERWDYDDHARNMIAQMKAREVEEGTLVTKPGAAWGGSDCTNISYFFPGFLRVFGEFTDDVEFWGDVADKCYEVIDNNLEATGAVYALVTNWCKADGTESHFGGMDYGNDAIRFPINMSYAYAWYGDPKAKRLLDKVNGFIASEHVGGIDKVLSGYETNGTAKTPNWHTRTSVGTFAPAGIALTDQELINRYSAEFDNIGPPYSYFERYFNLFGQMMINGLWTNPMEL